MKNYLIIGLILISQFGQSQIKEMYPSSVNILNLSEEGEKIFNENLIIFQNISQKLSKGLKYDDLTKKEKEVYDKVDETKSNYWDIIGDGCSWYCGGGPEEVTASSFLKSEGSNSYEANNAHDLNYKNAWVEGVPGYGIGEYLLYKFRDNSPRITEIIVVNGYVKNKTTWENNSRVKKLKVYINDKPFAILNLEDKRSEQSFKVDPIGNSYELKKKADWTLKFEIMEVYKGLKYDDVAISEIYFDGIDVHCFAKGTKVMMADNSTKNIEDLKIGDSTVYYDFTIDQLKSTKIEKLEKIVHENLVKYIFESGIEITSTQDHPFRVKGKGWASLNPTKSNNYEGFDNIHKIQIGDYFITANGSDKLVNIEYLKEKEETYTISKLSEGDNFLANGFVVGVEKLRE